MDKLYSSLIAVVLAVFYLVTLTHAVPVYLSEADDELDELEQDSCQVCLDEADPEACQLCVALLPGDEPIEKRSTIRPLFHPLIRGGYPKKNTYKPFFHPLIRGGYLKKAYTPSQPMYHPFHRGGFIAYPAPQRKSVFNTEDDI